MSENFPVQDLLDRMTRNWPEAVSPESQIVIALIRFGDLIRKRTDRVLDRHNLTPAAYEVLVTLRAMAEPRQMTPTDLYRSTLLTSGGMTKVLIELERRGAVERIHNPEDGRSRIVRMTPVGKALAEDVTREVNLVDHSHFDALREEMSIDALRDNILRMVAATERRN